VLGQETGHEQPLRIRPHTGNIIGVDVHEIPADPVCGERNRVGLGHQIPIPHVDHSSVFPHPGPDPYASITRGQLEEKAFQKGLGKLSGRKCLFHGRRTPHCGRLSQKYPWTV